MANLGPSDGSIHTFTTDRQRWKSLKGFARANRRQPTPAEAQLWQALRTNQLGLRFRRQHAIKDYIVDFVCLPAWLVVEVDGEIHQVPQQAEYDGGRTHALQECGFLVVRYSNEAVLYRLPEVLADIERHLKLLMG
ncbi:MAG: endonuclease domain-containing protein [Hymenobacter sp.]|nr:MAG: endonuclease domain-containing protein [Hymenobacter sp.]